MVGQDLSDQRVLDAFGGSGLLGLEAWSRGAEVTVVERRSRVARQIRTTAELLGAPLEVRVGDVLQLELGCFDGVLADPPYAMDPALILPRLRTRGWLVYEASRSATLPADLGGLILVRERIFGDTKVWILHALEEGG